MISEEYLDAEYFGNMTQLFQAAYHRDFTKQEMLRCKTMFPKAIDWYASLKPHQREAVDTLIREHYKFEFSSSKERE